MSIFSSQRIRRLESQAYSEAQDYCNKADVRLRRDSVEGYWIHYNGYMQFVRYLKDVRGAVDWLDWTP